MGLIIIVLLYFKFTVDLTIRKLKLLIIPQGEVDTNVNQILG